MSTSFASRISAYFGALFLAAIGSLFFLWYFGLPQIGLVGASNQHIAGAMRIMEVKADFQRTVIANGLKERRGDILVISESKTLAKQVASGGTAAQPDLERLFDRLQRAYPDRYTQLMIVDPVSKHIRASSTVTDVGGAFYDPGLIKRASQPGATEIIEQLRGKDGALALAIVRQIHAADADGYPSGKLLGILIAFIDLRHFLDDGLQEDFAPSGKSGNTLLFGSMEEGLTRLAKTSSGNESFMMSPQVVNGFEGTLLQNDTDGATLIVVYRHLPLSGTQGWTIVQISSQKDVLWSLRERANTLVIAGVMLTLLALILISISARRVTRPLKLLARTARQLEAGDLSARATTRAGESREIVVLSEAINGMAESVQKSHNTLEGNVLERAAKLQRSEARHRTLFESTADAVLVLDQNAIIDCNPAALLIFGAACRDDLLGKHLGDLSSLSQDANDEARKAAARRIAQALTQGSVAFEGVQHRLDTGVHFSSEVLLSRMEMDGQMVLQATVRDISLRKLAEAELRIAAAAFESQEGMYVADAEWVILRINQAFTDITGYTAKDAVGALPRDLLGSGRHDEAFYRGMASSLEHVGVWQGEVWDRRKNGEVFPSWISITAVSGDDEVVTHFVVTLSDITLRKQAEDEIKSLAFYDPLTLLPNRRLLMNRLEQALIGATRHHHKGALLFVDLDDFKTLNDTLGHNKGDLLLQQVATRLSACVRECDTVARLGGDEFVLMLEDLSESTMEAARQAETVGEKILSALNQPYELGNYEHRSTPSIGVTLFGEHAESIDEPLKRADLAMYQAKAAGRNTLRFFDPQTQAVVTARAALETGMREGLAKDQFVLYYQPQVAGERQITGAEALVRWMHPERGMVSPAEFIPLAEETGVILPLGRWVLETACTQLALWARREDMAHLTLAVNVSARQFHQRDFVEQVLEVLKQTGANPFRLKLELTESMLISNMEGVIERMHALKAVGVGFSLDDFGTGYSSLTYLKRLPLDQLKIDQGFVRDILVDPNDAAIAKMVVALAGSLGLAVIAEGVETEAQREFLAGQGCVAYQGYLFSRPVPLDAFVALVLAG